MGDIQQDPSMEDILASIKRVIAEDGRIAATTHVRPARKVTPRAEPTPQPAAEQEPEDVLELDELVSEGEGLLSDDAAAASRQKLAALSALQERPAAPQPADGPLEAVVREMLRPMLKEWLDQNLPEIVEELVAREVARITGKTL